MEFVRLSEAGEARSFLAYADIQSPKEVSVGYSQAQGPYAHRCGKVVHAQGARAWMDPGGLLRPQQAAKTH